MLENLENFLEMNAELAWLLILIFAFLESFILSGVIVSAAILFTTCIFIYNAEVLPLYLIVPIAILGAHLGDACGFVFGKWQSSFAPTPVGQHRCRS